jgi:hypothetical protein
VRGDDDHPYISHSRTPAPPQRVGHLGCRRRYAVHPMLFAAGSLASGIMDVMS